MSNVNPLQLLRSSTANKRPLPAGLVDGRPAINTNSASPGLFFKDSTGGLVKVGPVHVGTTAPNVSPASGGATGNSVGEQWLDTTGGTYVLKIWDGSAWRSESGTFVDVNGDVMTGALVMDNQQQVRFRETTANGTNYIALQAPASVASDKTITLPDVNGTVVTTGDTGTVTSTMILNGTIVDADVNASAAIAGTKISPDFGSQTVQSTREFIHPLGVASAPSITFSGDLNTGLYSPGADQVAISTGGTGRAFINSIGDIGVGTASPVNYQTFGYGPTIEARGGRGGSFVTSNTDATVRAVLAVDANASVATLKSVTAHSLTFATNDIERLRITSDGKVGIGTSSPNADSQLHIVGSSYQPLYVNTTGVGGGGATFFRSGTQALYIGTGGSSWLSGSSTADGLIRAEANLVLATNGNTHAVTIDSSQRVGIGTASPLARLSVSTSNENFEFVPASTAFNGGVLEYLNRNTNTTRPDLNYYLGSTTGGSHRFWTDGTERARIDSSGRLGIGTSSPSSGLHVYGDGTSGYIISQGTTANQWLTLGGNFGDPVIGYPSTGSLRFGTTTDNVFGGFTERLRVTSDGKVGIGTSSPSHTLTVNGSISSLTGVIRAEQAANAGYVIGSRSAGTDFQLYNTGNVLRIYNGTSDALNIDTAGRVGIGTASPGQNITVQSAASGTAPTFKLQNPVDSNSSQGAANSLSAGQLLFGATGSYPLTAKIESVYNADASFGRSAKLIISGANGSGTLTERLTIDESGRVGIGTTSPATTLNVQASAGEIIRATVSSNTALYASVGADGNGGWIGGSTNLGLYSNGSERARIDSSGRLLVGTSSSSAEAKFIVQGGTTGAGGAMNIQRSATTASAGSTIGFINFTNSSNNVGATVIAEGDGTWSAGTSHPTRLVFSTTADGASSPTERLRITSDGKVGLGTSSPGAKLDVWPASSEAAFRGNSGVSVQVPAFELRGYNTNTTNGGLDIRTNLNGTFGDRVRITNDGLVGVGTTSPDVRLHVATGNATGYIKIDGGTSSSATTGLQFRADNNNYSAEISSYQGNLQFTTGANERARIDSSGRLLVGTSSARNVFDNLYAPRLQVEGTDATHALSVVINAASSDGSYLFLGKSRGASAGSNSVVQNGDRLGAIVCQGADGAKLVRAAQIEAFVDGTPGTDDMPGRLVFSTTADGASSPTERMRIRENGTVLIAKTAEDTSIVGVQVNTSGTLAVTSATTQIDCRRNSTDGRSIGFYRDGTDVGNISVTTTATAYNTSSDYRLKENVTAVTDGITRLQQLKPSRFNFIADPGTVVDGFIAHEVQDIVPEAITGEKDAVDDDGNPQYQGIDQSKLVPLLTAALQEAVAKIETLEARLTAAGL